jgi:hypothetical protein
MSLYIKDPNAVLDFAFDWKPKTNGVTGATSDWLASGETISSHTVTVEAGLTKDSDSESGGKVTVWLSGGTALTNYEVTCQIVTSASRTDERTMTIAVKDR